MLLFICLETYSEMHTFSSFNDYVWCKTFKQWMIQNKQIYKIKKNVTSGWIQKAIYTQGQVLMMTGSC